MAWHAKKSASGSKQWLTCPGVLAYVDSLPEDMRRPTGEAAMLGTAAHGLAEWCLTKKHQAVPTDMINTVIWLDADENAHVTESDCRGIETRSQLSADMKGVEVKFMTRIDERMMDGVDLYLDVCWSDMEEMGPGTQMFIEETFNMDWLRPGLGGTSDCTLFQDFGTLRIIDYKNGYVSVSADDNTQALTYALGVAQLRDWAFEDVEVVIVQPNSRGDSVKRWGITRDELLAFQERLAEGSDRVDEAADSFASIKDDAEFQEWSRKYLNAGTDDDHGHCTFCDALATCPAAARKAQDVAAADFDEDPPEGNPLEVHDDQSLERLVRVIKWGKWLDGYVKAAQTLGQRRLEQGLEVPGHKLVRGKSNRAWQGEPDEIASTIAEKLGVDPDECYEAPKPPALKSPAQMEKLGKPRSKERKLAKELVGDLAHKPEGKLAMAPLSDPRDEVAIGDNAADDFVDDVPWDQEA
jgi:hypothetical protein